MGSVGFGVWGLPRVASSRALRRAETCGWGFGVDDLGFGVWVSEFGVSCHKAKLEPRTVRAGSSGGNITSYHPATILSGIGAIGDSTRWSTTLPSKVNLPHAINFTCKSGHVTPQYLGTTRPACSTVWTELRDRYRGTSIIKNTPLLGPYSGTIPRVLWQSLGGGLSLMSEVPL